MAKTTHESQFLLTAKDRTEATLGKAKKNILGVGSAAMRATTMIGGLIGVAGIGALTRQAIDAGSALTDMASATNTGVEELQALIFAAQEAGASEQDLARALRNIQQRAIEAQGGTKSYADALGRLNINTETFIGLPTERKLEVVGRALVNAEDKQQAYADIIRFVGEESGPRLIEALQRLGTEGFDEVSAAAFASGQIMKQEVAERMDQAADRIAEFQRRIKNFTANLVGIAMQVGDDIGGAVAGMVNSLEGIPTVLPDEDDGDKSGKDFGSSFAISFEREIDRSAGKIESGLTRIFSDFSEGAQGIVKNLGNFIVDEITEAFARSFIVNPLMDALNIGEGDNGGDVPAFNKIFKMFQHVPFFASGGSFTVGGAGGTDSCMVAFRATPGEHVSITRPGQNDGSGPSINIYQQFQPGVSPEALAFAQQQTKRDTMAAVDEAFKRSPRYARR